MKYVRVLCGTNIIHTRSEAALQCCPRCSSSHWVQHITARSAPPAKAPTRPRFRHGTQIVRSDGGLERQLLGEDLGARDPSIGEIESDFAEKTLWNWDTTHLTRAPETIGELLGLAAKKCSETEPVPVDEKERELLRNQVAGWRVESVAAAEGIRRDWTAQGPEQAEAIKKRLLAVASSESHPCDVKMDDHAVPLSRRDFVLAAKINGVDLSDLEQKKRARYWA